MCIYTKFYTIIIFYALSDFLINQFLSNPNFVITYQLVEPLIEFYMKNICQSRLYMAIGFISSTTGQDRIKTLLIS